MRIQNHTHSNLWSQFKKGDRDAFEKLYQQYNLGLIHYGSKICSNREILKDTIQDLFIELWHSRENLAPVDCVQFYLLKALRYKLIRAEKKRQQQTLISNASINDHSNSFYTCIETEIIDKEIYQSQVDVLRKAVKALTKRQQEVIQLRFYEGLTNEQIAEMMDMNYQSVSNLIYTALCRIKKNLARPVFASFLSAAFYLFF